MMLIKEIISSGGRLYLIRDDVGDDTFDDIDQRTNMLRRTTTSLATVGFAGDTFSPVLGSLTLSYSVSFSWSSVSLPLSPLPSASLFLSHYVGCYTVECYQSALRSPS